MLKGYPAVYLFRIMVDSAHDTAILIAIYLLNYSFIYLLVVLHRSQKYFTYRTAVVDRPSHGRPERKPARAVAELKATGFLRQSWIIALC